VVRLSVLYWRDVGWNLWMISGVEEGLRLWLGSVKALLLLGMARAIGIGRRAGTFSMIRL
jgi:hypothetical protein